MIEKANKTSIKPFVKSVLIVVAPLVVLLAVFVGGFAVSNRVTAVRRAGQAADAVYDFNYLLATLEQNVPSLRLLQIRDGIDLMAIGGQVQEILETDYSGNYITRLYRLVGQAFIGPLGSTYPTGRLTRLDYTAVEWENSENRRMADAGFDPEDILGMLVAPDLNPGYDVRFSEMMQAIAPYIIAEGRIAYYGVVRFSERRLPYECYITQQFLEEIADFEHLIIDLRGVTGGALWFFDEMLGRHLIREEKYAYFHNFYRGGGRNLAFFDAMGSRRPQSSAFNAGDFAGVISAEYLHVLDYLADMDFHYMYRYTLTPSTTPSGFSGKIWILIDEYTTGAAQIAAAFYKEIGFATFVGNTTGGGAAICSVAGVSNFITLPNTSFVVRYDVVFTLAPSGRPIEYGTEPHYFNRSGMCALETVMALIEER